MMHLCSNGDKLCNPPGEAQHGFFFRFRTLDAMRSAKTRRVLAEIIRRNASYGARRMINEAIRTVRQLELCAVFLQNNTFKIFRHWFRNFCIFSLRNSSTNSSQNLPKYSYTESSGHSSEQGGFRITYP